jgi:hypothetical protein
MYYAKATAILTTAKNSTGMDQCEKIC